MIILLKGMIKIKQAIRKELEGYFSDIDQFEREIEALELAFDIIGYGERLLEDTTFWNHYLVLMERVYEGSQNDLEFEVSDEIAEKHIKQAEALLAIHDILKEYKIHPFEIYLLAIYFAKTGKEEE